MESTYSRHQIKKRKQQTYVTGARYIGIHDQSKAVSAFISQYLSLLCNIGNIIDKVMVILTVILMIRPNIDENCFNAFLML